MSVNSNIENISRLMVQAFDLYKKNRLTEAFDVYQKVTELDKSNFDCIHIMGIICIQSKQYQLAIDLLTQAIQIQENNPDVHYNLGIAYDNLNKKNEAIKSYQNAIKIDQNNHNAYSNKSKSENDLKRYADGLISAEASIKIKVNNAIAVNNKGNSLYGLGNLIDSLEAYSEAIKIDPNYSEAYVNRGNILSELSRWEEALISFENAIHISPNHSEAYSNRGNALRILKRWDEALRSYDKAIEINPANASAHSNKANVLKDINLLDAALLSLETALSITKNIDYALGAAQHLKMSLCNWGAIENYTNQILESIYLGKKVTQPFPLLALTDDANLLKKSSVIYAQDKYPLNRSLGEILKYPKKDKIRIGYFSPDFKSHPVAFLTAELFEIHDRDRFEIYAFSLQKASDDDGMRLRLKNAFDKFIEVEDLPDMSIAQMSRDLKIDIAVDLSGPTKNSRTRIFSYQAAPIQVNWLGFPGTLGADFIDYIVADQIIIPTSHQQHYSEKVVYLPNTYMVDDSKRIPSGRIFSKDDCGLPENDFIFCCFNNDYKFNKQVIESWSRILGSVKDSVLWIPENNPQFMENIKVEFSKRGINTSRVIFAKKLESMADHLARYALADLFLDTYPYNAHTTAVDSLKGGTPIVTLIGNSFASRVAASLLNSIGLSELITNSQDQYEKLAIEIATNPAKLHELRKKLVVNRLTSPLFNTALFTKHIEDAYMRMMESYWEDKIPEHIYIES